MWLAWDTAAYIAAGLIVASIGLRRFHRQLLVAVADVAKEAAVILGLYAVWQRAGDLTVTKTAGAVAHARWIWHAERTLRLPSEVSVQKLVLPHPLVVEALNVFYAVVHVPALVIFLIWLYARHRPDYPHWRNVGAVLTGMCLLIQAIPVAPPRLLAQYGFVDTAVKYGQSVYGPHGISIAPQLAAMPSVHVAWALFIAVVVLKTSTSRWRWLILLHPAATTFAVVATANHWWLDGIVAAALLPVAVLICAAANRLMTRQRVRAVIASTRDTSGGLVPAPVGDN
jgi:hypothetical protein